MLVIGSSALPSGGGFTTEGPEGSHVLDFLFNYLLDVRAGLDLPSPASDISVIDIDIGSPNTVNILDITPDDVALSITLPLGASVDIAWPQIDTISDGSNVFESSSASNDLLQLNLDVDQFAFGLFGLPSLCELHWEFLDGAVYADIDLLDLDISGGLNLLQDFAMAVQGLPGTLTFEDNSSHGFVFGSDITIMNASTLDLDNDGEVEFTLTLAPDVDLTNDTDLGFNVGYSFLIGRLVAGYDLSIDLGLFDVDLGSDSVTIGPRYQAGGTLPLGRVDVSSDTFGLAFVPRDLFFST